MELAVVAFATLWPVLVLAQAAVRQVEPQWLEVGAALELSAWQRARCIVLPAMVPRLFVALRLAVAIALVVSVTVEIAANPHGMGYAMMVAQQSLDPALMPMPTPGLPPLTLLHPMPTLICDCNRTMPLDRPALAQALSRTPGASVDGIAEPHSGLCRREAAW